MNKILMIMVLGVSYIPLLHGAAAPRISPQIISSHDEEEEAAPPARRRRVDPAGLKRGVATRAANQQQWLDLVYKGTKEAVEVFTTSSLFTPSLWMCCDAEKRTPLHLAIANPDLRVFEYCLGKIKELERSSKEEAFLACDKEGRSLLMYAVLFKKSDYRLLIRACEQTDLGIVSRLLFLRDAKGVNILAYVLAERDNAFLIYLLKVLLTDSPLLAFIDSGVIKQFFFADASTFVPDSTSGTPFHIAALAGAAEAIRHLIKALNKRDDLFTPAEIINALFAVEGYRRSALHFAALRGHYCTVHLLLEALQAGERERIISLTQQKALVNARSQLGKTPLMLAAYVGCKESVKMLAPSAPLADLEEAAALARKYFQTEVVHILTAMIEQSGAAAAVEV